MKAIIIEDEKAAVRNLLSLLEEIQPEIDVQTVIDSIAGTLEWFASHSMPDLVFMDIHLADGSAFEIFEHVHITCPIIFTTAYDEYALRAFKVNSIDYLLKPIGRNDIECSFAKLESLYQQADTPSTADNLPAETYDSERLLTLMHSLRQQENYKSHFLIPTKGDKLLPVPVEVIHLFYIKDCQVKAVLANGTEYSFPQTLDELVECLNPAQFFRANRQFLISREAIKDIDLWFNSRLSINLRYAVAQEKILVSKARVTEFKEWFGRK